MELAELYTSLDKRWRPETVAVGIKTILGDLNREEQRTLNNVAQHNRSWSSMNADFHTVANMDESLAVAAQLSQLEAPSGLDLASIAAFIEQFESIIRKKVNSSDFKIDRLNREQRTEAGIGEMSRR